MAKNRGYYERLARQAAVNAGIDPDIFVRQINAESGFNPNAKSAYAGGIAQITPATAKGWGVDPYNPRQALNVAAKHMAGYIDQYGGWENALVAYNAGPGRVGKPLYAETSNYIQKILNGQNPKASTTRSAVSMNTDMPDTTSSSSVIDFIMKGSPLASYMPKSEIATPEAQGSAASNPRTPQTSSTSSASIKALPRRKGEANYAYLQRLGQTLFGLQNDPGDSQTTGGKHTTNSYHYRSSAVDFGDGRNSWDKLNRWYNWVDKHRKQLGIAELLNEGDHIHVAMR